MATIDEFFAQHRYALVELDPSKGFGRSVYSRLAEGGREISVVLAAPTLEAQQLAGTVYTSLADVPGQLDGVIFNIENDPDRMLAEVAIAVGRGVPRIWIENRCDASEAVQYALEHGVQVVDNACSLLALEPHNVHWLHRRILSLAGREPMVKQPVRAELGTTSQGRL